MLTREKDLYLLCDFFSAEIYAGFTKPNIEGKLPQDCAKITSKESVSFAFMKQIHSSKIHLINQPGIYEGDGLFTKEESLTLIVKTADCLPLLFYSQVLGVIGVVHMGWRSAKEGILENIPFPLDAFRVLAGVSMRKCCYQVGEEFLNYSQLNESLEKRNNNYYFDPINFAKKKLFKLGLKQNRFFDLNICSNCNPENFLTSALLKKPLKKV